MKTTRYGLVVLAFFLVWSCLPRGDGVRPTPSALPAADLMAEADRLYALADYAPALEAYREYLLRFPDNTAVPAVMMKIGSIHLLQGRYADTRSTFESLIARYPQSPFAADARFEILVTYFREQRYREVIRQAAPLLAAPDNRRQNLRTCMLLGDVHLALKNGADGLFFFTRAFEISNPDEHSDIRQRMQTAVGSLSIPEIIDLLNRVSENPPAGYLLFQLGRNYYDTQKYSLAAEVLQEFVQRYPRHEFRERADRMLVEIERFGRYTIGCLLPLSGSYQSYGQRALRAIELAFSLFGNQQAYPAFELAIKDTASDPLKAAQAVAELHTAGAAAIIGPIVTAAPAVKAAQELGIPIVVLNQKSGVTEAGDYVFRNFITAPMQMETLVAYAVEELGLRRFAILYPDENYGHTFMHLFWDQVIARGGTVVGLEAYDPQQTDFSDVLKRLTGLYYEVPRELEETVAWLDAQNALQSDPAGPLLEKRHDFSDSIKNLLNPSADAAGPEAAGKPGDDEDPEPIIDFEAVFIPDAATQAGLIAPQLAFNDIENVLLLGTNLWHSSKLIDMARDYVQGAVMTDAFFSSSASPVVKSFVDAFENTFGETPTFIEALSYDTAMLLFQTLSRPDVGFGESIRDALLAVRDYQGVTGQTSVAADGDVRKRLYLLKIKGDRFVELPPP